MKLRPHHLLCLQKYTGSGYDAAFVSHMNELVQRLKAAPDTQIELTAGADAICGACPHNESGTCASREKVTSMDQGVIQACGFSPGERSSWRALARTAREKIFQTEEFERICGDCQWIELCRNTRKGSLDGTQE